MEEAISSLMRISVCFSVFDMDRNNRFLKIVQLKLSVFFSIHWETKVMLKGKCFKFFYSKFLSFISYPLSQEKNPLIIFWTNEKVLLRPLRAPRAVIFYEFRKNDRNSIFIGGNENEISWCCPFCFVCFVLLLFLYPKNINVLCSLFLSMYYKYITYRSSSFILWIFITSADWKQKFKENFYVVLE